MGMTIDNALCVTNSKGGVGKTSLVANIAVTAALAQWRVLAVDLDPQGNLGRDLGYRYRDDATQGRGLFDAVFAGGVPAPLSEVRAGLDVIDGGQYTKKLADLLAMQALEENSYEDYASVEDALAPLSADYDLVLLDCPPAGGRIGRAALSMAHYVVVPTRVDDASIDGLEGLAEDYGEVKSAANPSLTLLGVVLFDVGAGDSRLREEVRDVVNDIVEGIAPVMKTAVRHSRRSAWDMRRRGLVAAEYERAALEAAPWYAASGDGEVRQHFSSAAGGLAGDYQELTNEILTAMVEHSQT